MPTHENPKLILKSGKRFIEFKGKRYRIESKLTDKEVVANINELIRDLKSKRKKSKQSKKSTKKSKTTQVKKTITTKKKTKEKKLAPKKPEKIIVKSKKPTKPDTGVEVTGGVALPQGIQVKKEEHHVRT